MDGFSHNQAHCQLVVREDLFVVGNAVVNGNDPIKQVLDGERQEPVEDDRHSLHPAVNRLLRSIVNQPNSQQLLHPVSGRQDRLLWHVLQLVPEDDQCRLIRHLNQCLAVFLPTLSPGHQSGIREEGYSTFSPIRFEQTF